VNKSTLDFINNCDKGKIISTKFMKNTTSRRDVEELQLWLETMINNIYREHQENTASYKNDIDVFYKIQEVLSLCL